MIKDKSKRATEVSEVPHLFITVLLAGKAAEKSNLF